MPLYYFDIETTGIEPLSDQVITIQYAMLNDNLDNVGELQILKIWEFGSEKELISEFLAFSNFFEENFAFVPVGNNLIFDIIFLYERASYYNLVSTPLWKVLLEKPFLDLKHVAVMINNMRFQGYNKLIDMNMKDTSIEGSDVPRLFKEGKYTEIEKYIRSEFEATLKFAKDALKQCRKSIRD
ncbi:MAG: ribonuclease H-like domain-containing protein [Thermoprotei archaeon]